ncbi:MAG: hypothetical protein AAF847_08680 [Bacteroidota bacterium]
MKYLNILFLLLVFAACEYDSFEDEIALSGLPDTDIPAFIRFDNGLDPVITLAEADGSTSVRLDFQFPVESDLTVDFSFGGDAVFGEDFTVANSSASGGSLTIEHDPENIAFTTGDLEVMTVIDTTADGTKELIITLTNATAADGTPVNVGQGDLHKTATFSIVDEG